MVQKNEKKTGFTLIELLVTLVVTSIILSAVATLAYAMTSASRTAEDVAASQAQVRTATVHVLNLIQNCRMICAAPGDDLAVWEADKNGDGQVNVNELVYLERGADHDVLKLGRFPKSSSDAVAFSSLSGTTTKGDLATGYGLTDPNLIRSCRNVEFAWDQAPPLTRRLAVSFDLTEGGVAHHYEIVAAMLGSAAHLLNADATDLVTDDD
jgi:prepilin-type N-terminal cleavage/methylation domain-containing protein